MINPKAVAAVNTMQAHQRKLERSMQGMINARHTRPGQPRRQSKKQRLRFKKAWRRLRNSEQRLRRLILALAGQGADPLLLPMRGRTGLRLGQIMHQYDEAVAAYLEDPNSEDARHKEAAFRESSAEAIQSGSLPVQALPTFNPASGATAVRAAHARYVERTKRQLPF